MDFVHLFRYHDRCRRLLQETLETHPDALDRPIQTLSSYNSIRSLIAHMVGVEQRWIVQRIGGKQLQRYEDQPAETLYALFADWKNVRAVTYAFLAEADVEMMQKKFDVTLPHWNFSSQLTVEQILFQMSNHETHHRAQISMALQQMQIDPPNFDYIFVVATANE